MINTDSYFNKIPLNLNYQDLLIIEGIKYSFMNIDLTFSRIIISLNNISLGTQSEWTSIFLEIWSFIDNISRLLKLTKQLQGNKTEINKIIDQLIIINNFRNSIQHIDERIVKDGLKDIITPLYGELEWIHIKSDSEISIFRCFAGPIRTQSIGDIVSPVGQSINYINDIGRILFYTFIKKSKSLKKEKLDVIAIYILIQELYNILNNNLKIIFDESIKLHGSYGSDFMVELKLQNESNNIL